MRRLCDILYLGGRLSLQVIPFRFPLRFLCAFAPLRLAFW